MVSVELHGADAERTRAVIGELSGLERVIAEQNELALFVEDGASSIAEIVRRLDAGDVEVGRDLGLATLAGRRLPRGDRPAAGGCGAGAGTGDESAEEDEAAAKAVVP